MQILKNLKFGTKIISGFSFVLLVMTIISVIIFFNVNALVNSSKWVNHTYEVIRVAETVSGAMVDMETGQRGFMITGEDAYLEPYNNGITVFTDLITKGSELTSDNPSQVTRWQEVMALKKRWMSEVAEKEIAARRDVNLGAEALANFKTISARTTGKEIFDKIRGSLASIEGKLSGNLLGEHLLTKITLDVVNMETGQRGFLLTGQEPSLEPYVNGQKDLKKHLAELEKMTQYTSVTTKDVTTLQQLISDWSAKAAEPEINARREMNKYSMSIDDISQMMKDGDGKLLMDATRAKLKEIVDAEEVLIEVRGNEQQNISAFTISFTIIGTLLAIATGLGIAFMVTRGVVGPVKQTNKVLKQLSEGDLTKRINVDSKDEIGEMGKNFNEFTGTLQDSIGQIADSTQELVSASDALAGITEETNSGVQNQKSETEQVAAAITEMSATVEEVAQNAQKASQAAKDADDEAKSGNHVVDQTIHAIQNLASEVSDASDVIENLKNDSENIGTVVDVIKEIAEQTNLLALNAAIEAARAGDQGRGFAVVADEVRTLAQRTQDSTTEIEGLIESLQQGAERSVRVMETSRNNANETVTQAQAAGDSLTSIAQAVGTISEMNTFIATAAEQQSAVAEDINRSIARIQEISEETAHGAQQTSNSSVALASLGEQLQKVVTSFKI